MNIIRTTQTYKTVENARMALVKKLARGGLEEGRVRYLIAVAEDGRFAPVLVGAEYIPFIHHGVTVVG